MFTLSKDYNHHNATITKPSSSASPMSVSSAASSSASLHYINCDKLPAPRPVTPSGSPKPKKLCFGTPKRVTPLSPKPTKSGDSKHRTSMSPVLPASSPTLPPKIQITVEKCTTNKPTTSGQPPSTISKYLHLASLIDAVINTNRCSLEASEKTIETSEKMSDLQRELTCLYKDLGDACDQIEESQKMGDDHQSTNGDGAWEDSEEEEETEKSNQPNASTTDAAPITNPAKPVYLTSQWDSGEHPGEGWVVNDPLSNLYYPVPIIDPKSTIRCLIIAPYICCNILDASAQVAATYGKGYAIYGRTMNVVPTEYPNPPRTPDQLTLLDPQAPFATAVQKVLDTDFPLYINTGIR